MPFELLFIIEGKIISLEKRKKKGGKLMNEAGGYLSKMRKGVHPVVKKTAKKTVKKAVKYIGKSTGFGLMEDLAYGGINKFGSWYVNNAIDAWVGR